MELDCIALDFYRDVVFDCTPTARAVWVSYCRSNAPGPHQAESTDDRANALNETLDNLMSDTNLARMKRYVRQSCNADPSADILMSRLKHARIRITKTHVDRLHIGRNLTALGD